MKRPWYAVDRRMIFLAIVVGVITCFPYAHRLLFPTPTVACVVSKDGEVFKAWDAGCDVPDAEVVRLRLK